MPRPRDVRKALANRCAWLMKRIQQVVMAGDGVVYSSPLISELAATVLAMEAYDAAVKARLAAAPEDAT